MITLTAILLLVLPLNIWANFSPMTPKPNFVNPWLLGTGVPHWGNLPFPGNGQPTWGNPFFPSIGQPIGSNPALTGQQSSSYAPEQVHLSLGRDESEIIVSWVTLSKETPTSTVEVAEHGKRSKQQMTFQGSGYCFDAGKITGRYININHAKLTGLKHGTVYDYRIQSELNGQQHTSNWFTFRTLNLSKSSPKIAFFGNMGLYNNEMASLDLLKKMASKKEMDVVVHIGDMAYDLETFEGKRGDQFMNELQPIASQVPYQVVPGDKENEKDLSYTQYNNRFMMIDKSGNTNNFFYSFNVGLIHFVALNTDFHMDNQFDKMVEQYKWLEKDLTEANENREIRPWIVVLMHHQIYCQNEHCHYCNDCRNHKMLQLLRQGTDLEELFYRYGVDVVAAAHDRVYQRTLPIFRNVECKSLKKGDAYDQPRGPVHVTSGAAGGNINWAVNPLPNAVRIHKEGISVIHSVTRDALTIDFILANGRRADRFTIKNRNRSGPRYSCT